MKSRTAFLIGPVVLVLIALVVPAAVATDGPNVQATVGFGQWQTDPPLDRFTNPNDRTRNEHVLGGSEPGSKRLVLMSASQRRRWSARGIR